MTTPILLIPEVAGSQIDQYLTYNQALRFLEAAANDVLVVDLSAADATVTNLSPDFEMLRYQVFESSGNTVARTITFSANKRAFKVDNAGSFDLDVIIGSTTITVPTGNLYSFYADGTADGLKRAL